MDAATSPSPTPTRIFLNQWTISVQNLPSGSLVDSRAGGPFPEEELQMHCTAGIVWKVFTRT